MGEPDGLQVRACTAADVDAVLAVVRADEERATGRPSQLVAGDVRGWWQPLDLETCSWLVTPTGPGAAAQGGPVGAAWMDVPGGGLGVVFPVVAPLPDGDRARVWALLVELAERRAAELGLPRMHVAAMLPDPVAEALVPARGYRSVRLFYEMAIELQAPPEAVALPEGFTLRPAAVEDARGIHATLEEAFEDHWEHYPEPFDQWWRDRSSDPEFDITWWFAVHEGDRMAAAIRTVPDRNGGVYVAALGVRRPWRGRGLAKALLQHAFGRAWEAGFTRVTLGVDAASPTGATALYRSVGMASELETQVWEKP